MAISKPESIDAYIAGFPEPVRKDLEMVRQRIRKLVPMADETISYGIPTIKLHDRNLVHFAGFKNHIGLYPTPGAAEAFKKDLAAYKTGKGSIQFPLGEAIPLDLISRIVQFRLSQLRDDS